MKIKKLENLVRRHFRRVDPESEIRIERLASGLWRTDVRKNGRTGISMVGCTRGESIRNMVDYILVWHFSQEFDPAKVDSPEELELWLDSVGA